MADELLTFSDTNAEQIETDVIQGLEDNLETPLYPGDRRRIFLNAVVYVMTTFWEELNEKGRQRFLKYASAEILDEIGAGKNCERIKPTAATVNLKFTLSTARIVATEVPAGTRATADANYYFATDQAVIIPAGQTESATVSATATVSGAGANGYEIGMINTIADQGNAPYVSGVSNTTATAGGDDGEPYPYNATRHPDGDDGSGDDRYRARIYLAGNQHSTAGSIEAYQYYTLSANAQIDDVKILSDNTAGTIDVYITKDGGADPTEDMISDVLAALNAKKVRPIGDLVTCQGPTVVPYSINIKYYTTSEDEADAVLKIEGDGGAIAQYIKWQDGTMGRDINPDRLRAFCLAHCLRLDVTSPELTVLSDDKIARANTTITVTHEVVTE